MEIEIGKMYIFKPKENAEYRCGVCGGQLKLSPAVFAAYGRKVKVTSSWQGQEIVHGGTCKHTELAKEGIYRVFMEGNGSMAVPYTMLEPVKKD